MSELNFASYVETIRTALMKHLAGEGIYSSGSLPVFPEASPLFPLTLKMAHRYD